MLTGRDARATRRIKDMLDQGEQLAGRIQAPGDLLCRPGRSGGRRKSLAPLADHGDADGQFTDMMHRTGACWRWVGKAERGTGTVA